MTTGHLPRQSQEQLSSVSEQEALIQMQQKQANMLEPFYERLIGMTFNESSTAIDRCRDLCAEFGFTVKQEASTHKNIYVYCSREGLPDSLRNPKSNPQRKRPSRRCDCRWRVVLHELDGHWEFRKSLNPEAGKHNHALMDPNKIERNWPKEVIDLIYQLARLRISTQDIRQRVKTQYPNLNWNERRFYNRLSEERQKIKMRESMERTQQLTQLWSKICMTSAGNENLFKFVKEELDSMFEHICKNIQLDVTQFPSAVFDFDDDDSSSQTPSDDYNTYASSNPSTSNEDSKNNITKTSSAKPEPIKGYLTIEIPKQHYYVKIHNQKQIQETQTIKTRRSRNLTEDNFNTIMEPSRKISRKGKSRESSSSFMMADSRIPHEPIHTTISPHLAQSYQPAHNSNILNCNTGNNFNNNNDSSFSNNSNNNVNNSNSSTSNTLTFTNSNMNHNSINNNNNNNMNNNNHSRTQGQARNNERGSISMTAQPQTSHHHSHEHHTTNLPPSFVYPYDSSNMSLDTSLSSYVNPSFQNTYSLTQPPNPSGYHHSDSHFSFDTSHTSMIKREITHNSNNNMMETTMHAEMSTNSIDHLHKSAIRMRSIGNNNNDNHISHSNHDLNTQRHTNSLYSMSPPVLSNTMHTQKSQLPIYQRPMRMSQIYDSSKDTLMSPAIQSPVHSPQHITHHTPYHPSTHALYMHPSNSPNHPPHTIPMYHPSHSSDSSKMNQRHPAQ